MKKGREKGKKGGTVSIILCILMVVMQMVPGVFALDTGDADLTEVNAADINSSSQYDSMASPGADADDSDDSDNAGDSNAGADDRLADADAQDSSADAAGSENGGISGDDVDAADRNDSGDEAGQGQDVNGDDSDDYGEPAADDAAQENGDADSRTASEDAEIYGDVDLDVLAVSDAEQMPEWYENGKNTGTFEISSATALRELAGIVNKGVTTFSGKTVVLTADIDMSQEGAGTPPEGDGAAYTQAAADEVGGADDSDTGAVSAYAGTSDWDPIGNSASVFFAGTFDGSGYTIKNINMSNTDSSGKYTGLFGCLRGTVTGVTLEDCKFDTVSTYAGAIAGYVREGGSVTDCSINDLTLKTSAAYAGAAAGYSQSALSDITVTGNITIEGSANTTDSSEINEYCFGGAVGMITNGELRHIINRASVTVTSAVKDIPVYAGGIAGKTDNVSLMINCGNSGAVSCSVVSTVCAGGLAGETDTVSVKNCWNKGSVTSRSSSGSMACAGGLLGESGAESIYNSYNDTTDINGDLKYKGYIVGYIISEDAPTVLDYVYWPGNGTYTSTLVYGSASVPADAQSTCRGIKKIPSSSSLIKRLNNQVIDSCDDETLTTDMYMWKLTDESAPKSSPEFRESAPAPVFPNRPSMTAESNEAALHVSESDPAHDAKLNVSVRNSDTDVSMEYQWQVSSDNISFRNISAGTAASDDDAAGMHSLSISGETPGVRYYRLKVNCSDEKADADRAYYSESITVKTGWRIKIAAGGYFDGTSIADGGTAEDIFPVIPDSGAVALPKAISSGNYFLGYADSYAEGQVYDLSTLITEYDTAGMTGDVTLWSIFRPAAKVAVTIVAGSETAKVIEGVTDDKLSFILDEGHDYVLPDGNELFINEGWRFIGWRISKTENETPSDGKDDKDDNAAGENETEAAQEIDDSSTDIDDELKIYAVGDTYTAETYDITVRAVWSKLYTVSYESSSSYTGDLPEPAQYIEGETVTVADADIMRDGYKLKNWIDSAGGQQYKAGSAYKMPAQDVVMQANWIVLFQIMFEPSEKSGIEINGTDSLVRTVNVGEGEFLTLPDQGNMVADGYQFMGWSDTSNIGRIFKPGERYYITMPEAFYGVWYKICKVTFDRGSIEGETISGSDPEPIECLENETIQLPSNPYTVTTNKDGVKLYKLTGWRDNETGIVHSPLSSIKIGKKDISYTAQWRAVDDANSWNGGYTEIEGGKGTAADPYIIKTPEELAYISHMVLDGKDTTDMYFSLANDIDLTGVDWTPIGMYHSEQMGKEAPFNGVFSGNGHSVTGLTSMYDMSGSYVSVGLFGYTGSRAQIKDLNVSDADITASLRTVTADGKQYSDTNKYIGILSGINKGSISNCTVSGQVKVIHGNLVLYTKRTVYLGGITGRCENASVRSSKNNATVLYTRVDDGESDPVYIGGITGYAEESEITDDCVNNGDISFDGQDYYMSNLMGGIVAYADSRSSISSCTNSGAVTRTDGGYTMMGGIGGLLYCNVCDCENRGRVEYILRRDNTFSGSEGYQFTGGIAGKSYGTITRCMNSGEIINTVKSAYHHVAAAGGISGAALGSISKCGNTGSVNMDACVAILDSYYLMSTGPENKYRGLNVTSGGIAGELCNASVSNSFSYGRALTTLYDSEFDFRTGENAWLAMSDGGIVGIICNEYTISGYWSKDKPDLNRSSITNCYWLVSSQPDPDKELQPTDQEGIYASYADGSRRIKASETASGKTAEQFKSGEVAYLIDGGAGTRANSWTQGTNYTDLGSPQYYKAYVDTANSNGSATLKYGTNDSTTVYAPSDGEVGIVMPKGVSGYEQAYGDQYDKYDENVSGGVIHHWKQDYYVNVPTATVKTVKGSEKIETEQEQNGSDLKFNMPSADVVVQLAFMDQETFKQLIEKDPSSLTKVTRNESQFEAKEEPEPKPEPEPDKSSGGGGGGGKTPSTDPPGHGEIPNPIPGPNNENTSPEGTENGTGIPDNASSLAPSDANVSDSAVTSQEPPAFAEQVQVAESAPQMAGDITEDYEEEEQEPEEQPEEQTPEVYEVIQKAVQTNPVATAILILLILIIIIAAAVRRIRKARK